jgi:hypothetical protein
MTLAYSSSTINDAPLLSLDNSKEALVHNVKFTTVGIDLSTSSSITTGTGLLIRGIGAGGGAVDPSNTISIGTRIENCVFENMGYGVKGVDYVLQPVITHCTFENLYEGIRFERSAVGQPVPQAAVVSNSLFRFIYSNAINVTSSTFVSNLMSNNNAYYYVGNYGYLPDDLVDGPTTAILNFNSAGNISVNDYFHRGTLYSENPALNLEYYNPLAEGYVKIINNSTRRYTSQIDSQNQQFFKIPLINGDQAGAVEYQLTNEYVTRSGRLTISISDDGYASISDQYNFSETEQDESNKLIFSTSLDYSHGPYYATYVPNPGDRNFIALTLSNLSTSTAYLTYNIDLTLNPPDLGM